MSADGVSALAVDDLSRSLMGWQFSGWQFEIAHQPLKGAAQPPGAQPLDAPEFDPVPGHTPDAMPEDTGIAAAPGLLAPSGPGAAFAAPLQQDTITEHDPREIAGAPQTDLSAPPRDHGPANLAPAHDMPGAPNAHASAEQYCEQPVTPHEGPPDFFEFNIIVQINVLMDSDLVAQHVTGASEPSLYGLGFGQWAGTGGNTQGNHALIADAQGHADFDWLGGQYYETNAVFSLNALDDSDAAHSFFKSFGLDSIQSTTSGGNTQMNDAAIRSLTGSAGPAPADVQIGAGDIVDYNIIKQFNVMDDSDVVSQDMFGSDGGSQIADTGGNEQFNSAVLIDDNDAPDHDVGGNYYEYNMIYQANFLDDGDQITQIATAGAPHDAQTSQLQDTTPLHIAFHADTFV
jgi:hypothetical protein